MRFKFTLFLFLITGSASSGIYSQTIQSADQIVAVVNDKIVLKSEIDTDVATYIRQSRSYGQPIEFSKELWYQFLNASVENKILLEKAKLDSIVVPDDRVNRAMDNRVSMLVQQAGSEQALEQAFGKSIIQLKAEFREEFRKQMIADMVRQNKYAEIKVTRPEVQEFFDEIPRDSLPTIPEQVALSQIVILPPPKSDAKKEAYAFAEQLRDSIVSQNVPFEDIARRHGTDGTAANGGLLPLMPLNQLVAEYSAAAAALQPGQISEVVETEFGFHIIKLVKRVGDQIETRHVLITVNSNELDDQFAIDRLNAIRDSLISNPEMSFANYARKVSQDPATKVSGGKITDPQTGERLIALNRLDPALYRVVLLMDEVGTISEPKQFNPNNANSGKGYRIIRLDKQVPEHIANIEQDYDRLKGIVEQQKQYTEYAKWMQELKNEFYIEYRIPVPKEMEIN